LDYFKSTTLAHHVTLDFELKGRSNRSHCTATNLFEKEWKIDSKVFGPTIDNGSNVVHVIVDPIHMPWIGFA